MWLGMQLFESKGTLYNIYFMQGSLPLLSILGPRLSLLFIIFLFFSSRQMSKVVRAPFRRRLWMRRKNSDANECASDGDIGVWCHGKKRKSFLWHPHMFILRIYTRRRHKRKRRRQKKCRALYENIMRKGSEDRCQKKLCRYSKEGPMTIEKLTSALSTQFLEIWHFGKTI